MSPDRFREYVEEHEAALVKPTFRRCLVAVASAFQAAQAAVIPSGEIEERSKDIAGRAGAPELGEKVAEQWSQTQGSPAVVAVGILTLGEILAGRVEYEQTFLYQLAAQQEQLQQTFVLFGGNPAFWEQYNEQTLEASRKWLEGVALGLK